MACKTMYTGKGAAVDVGALFNQDTKGVPFQEVEDVSNMILNKLNIATRPLRKRNKKEATNTIGMITKESTIENSVSTQIMENIFPGLIPSLIEDKGGLSNVSDKELLEELQEQEDDARKYTVRARENVEKSLDSLHEEKKLIAHVIARETLKDINKYSPKEQSILRRVFKSLFVENKFTTPKAGIYFIGNKRLKKISEEIEQEKKMGGFLTYGMGNKLRRINTLKNFIKIIPNYRELIENKINTEIERTLNYRDTLRKEDPGIEIALEVQRLNKSTSISGSDRALRELDLSHRELNKIKQLFPNFSRSDGRVTHNLQDVIKRIANSDSPHRGLAKSLLPYIKQKNLKIELMPQRLDPNEGAVGYYQASADTVFDKKTKKILGLHAYKEGIVLHTDSIQFLFDTEHLLLHETVHSLTSIFLVETEGMKGINNIYNKVHEYLIKQNKIVGRGVTSFSMFAGMNQPYGFTNPSEMIAEVLTNPEFQELLRHIPPIDKKRFRNALEQLLDFIVSLFKKTHYETLYDQIEELAYAAIEAQSRRKNTINEILDSVNKDLSEVEIVSSEQKIKDKQESSPATGYIQKDPKLRSRLFNDSTTISGEVLLERIAEGDHNLAPLAKKLIKYIKGTGVSVELLSKDILVLDNGVKARGVFHPESREIQIAELTNFEKGRGEKVILHEFIHAVTMDIIARNPTARARVRELMDAYQGKEGMYGMTDEYEFLSELFTDAKFMKELQASPAINKKFKNLWEELFEYIKSLFRFTPKEETLFDQAFALGTELIEQQHEEGANTQVLSKYLTKFGLKTEDTEGIMNIDITIVVGIIDGGTDLSMGTDFTTDFIRGLIKGNKGLSNSIKKKVQETEYYAKNNKDIDEAIRRWVDNEIYQEKGDPNSFVHKWWNRATIAARNQLDLSGTRKDLQILAHGAASEAVEEESSTEQMAINASYRADDARITKDFSEGKHDYFFDGKIAPTTFTREAQRKIDKEYSFLIGKEGKNKEIARVAGVDVHADFENEFRIQDGEKGVARVVHTDETTRKAIKKYLQILRSSHPKNTIWRVEMPIRNKETGAIGTPDLVAIDPDGTEHIYDWKGIIFKTTNGEVFAETVDEIKRRYIDYQLREIRRASITHGVTKFGNTRAIPARIKIKGIKLADKNWEDQVVGFELGNPDPRKEDKDKQYLLPIPSSLERTGIKEYDLLIEDLYKKLDVLNNMEGGTAQEREQRAVRKSMIKKAAQDLQVKHGLEGIINFGLAEIPSLRARLKEDEFEELSTNEKSKELERMKESVQSHIVIARILGDKLEKLDNKKKTKLKNINFDSNILLGEIIEKIKELSFETAEEEGIDIGSEGTLKPVLPSGKWDRIVRTATQSQNPLIQTFMSLVQKQQAKVKGIVDKHNVEIDRMRDNMQKARPGKSGLALFEPIVEIKDGEFTGNLTNRYKSEFFDERDKRIAKRGNVSIKWIADNTVVDKDKFDKKFKEMVEIWKRITFSPDKVQNKAIYDYKVNEFRSKYDVWHKDYKKTAYLNPSNYFLRPTDKWWTPKYSSLMNDPSKSAFKEFYLYFVGEIDKMREWIPLDTRINFIPNVPADLIDQMLNNGLSLSRGLAGLTESLRVETEDTFFGQQGDNGNIIKKIPLFFKSALRRSLTAKEKKSVELLALKKGRKDTEEYTKEYNSQKWKIINKESAKLKSVDLTKVLSLFLFSANNYKYMSDIENTSLLLKDAMREQEEIIVDFRGKPRLDSEGGVMKEVTSAETLEQFDDYILNYIYGRAKKDTLREVKLGGNTYSATKAGYNLLSYNSIRALSLNMVSGVANMFNGIANLFMQGAKGQFFSNLDVVIAYKNFAFGDLRTRTLVPFFDIQLDNTEWRKAERRSSSKLIENKVLSYERFFVLQKSGDMLVQWGTLLAFLNSHTVKEGKIVKKTGSETSFYKQIKIDKNNNVTIPDVSEQEMLKFRNKVKEISKITLGQIDPYDITRMRMTIWGAMAGQFRSWIPKMADERFGQIRYNRNLESWEYGKYRSFFKHLISKEFLPLVGNLLKNYGLMGLGGDGKWSDRTKLHAIALFEKAKAENPTLEITQEEYIQLHYQNLRAMVAELQMITGVLGIIYLLSSLDDEEDSPSGWYRYLGKTFTRFSDELLFFSLPSSGMTILKVPIPLISLLNDMQQFTEYGMKTAYLLPFGEDEDYMKSLEKTKKKGISFIPTVNGVDRFFSFYSD